jgi:DnaJ-like protein/uncharacterized protein DUF4388
VPDLDAPDQDAANAPFRGDAILVADPSPEGVAIADALRMRGFIVIELAPEHLDSRAIAESPRAVVVDIDHLGAIEAVERLRDLSVGAPPEVFFLGDPARAAEMGATRASGRAYARPVDLDAVVEAVVRIAQIGMEGDGFGTIPPPSFAHRRPTTPPPDHPSEAPGPPSELPSVADPFDVAAMLDDGGSMSRMGSIELSPELAQLLDAAEQRVLATGHPSSVPSPEIEHDILLSPELLAVLDEPIDPDDELGGTGSDLGTAAPPGAKRPTTSGSEVIVRSPTEGGPSTSAAAPITSAAPSLTSSMSRRIPASDPAPPRPSQQTQIAQPDSLPPAAPSTAPPPPPLESERPPPRARPTAPPIAAPIPAPVIVAPTPPASRPRATDLAPAVLVNEGDAVRALARAVAARTSGSIAVGPESALRRIVLRDGDLVTAASSADDETLVAFLAARGDLDRDSAVRLGAKLPPFGRHAGAALIAHGYLGQDDLWPVLRAHAEWIIGRALQETTGSFELEDEPPGRLKAEPGVFGGATGAEVLVEAIRRVIPPEKALERLGGPMARIDEGSRRALLAECALRREEEDAVRLAPGRTLAEILENAPPELCDVFYALVSLGVLDVLTPVVSPAAVSVRGGAADPLDQEAIRLRVKARMALVEDGDYFALLGIARSATGYEVKRAYLELRRAFEPARVLTAQTADLVNDVKTIVEVLDEAYEILRDPHRRERYRKAIEAGPP